MRRLLALLVAFCILANQTAALAAAQSDDARRAGEAANALARGAINATTAQEHVPGYTTTPAEATYYGQPHLDQAAGAGLAACAAMPNDPTCQALRGAVSSANTPREPVSATDPLVASAQAIARNPSLMLGSLASYYAGCNPTDQVVPGGTAERICRRYTGVGNYTVRRDLTVEVRPGTDCTDGQVLARGEARRGAADYMVAEVHCQPGLHDRLRFAFHAAGSRGACVGMQTVDLPTAPGGTATVVAHLSPHWSGRCWSPFVVVMAPQSGCVDGQCQYTFRFGTPVSPCPPPGGGGGDDPTPPIVIQQQCDPAAGTRLGEPAWEIALHFPQPVGQAETDTWTDQGTVLEAGGRCTVATADRCVDGPATRTIDGRQVTRACWSYERTLNCDGGAAINECSGLAAQGCTPVATTCQQTNAATGECEIHQDTYSCPTDPHTVTSIGSCPADRFCLGDTCFSTVYTADADFAQAMSMMEAAREAGVYIDPDTLQIFSGEPNRCRDRLLRNCCSADASGAGMTNQSIFGTGSKVVYDILMNADNRRFVYQGMTALLTGSGFSGAFTSYGVTVAVNGAALPAGTVTVFSGQSIVIAFNPWALAIAVVIYVVMSMMSCDEDEGLLAMKEGARLCHSTGSYCSSCIRVLGSCVSCIERTTGKCCFNSVLARIINEQGRLQFGKGWGDARNPDCSGFTVDQLQAMDFSRMDLTEFYASIAPTLPDVDAIREANAGQIIDCYYGKGKCE
ncbi:type-F conjugative transfer system mating-pair stabilization protein TraN [Xanthomonas hortorum]|uniref:Type-F conjugative transfer system mating-pair stabilization protein TraN n=1 Tax=Xanthomonas hortorum pv. hederae TaxID=453603 RepID=A0A9X4BNY6_9XANT|nr:type-F conjugative transfer system mating-pair stabilization protein TraN [Xanthomonas hortorum]MCE4369660.1 type-F conjugative transfer system mating-pair stabilization protein TraN [Xanthomonas hortorum pv. hederae]MDC8637158.1 type-F conjugative transfer system mating-pair stabilization protein TraN [Xanthomonas hortorum pv. hederae]PPU86203.1 conjugal transfer protein TraN [Xanthomonas hortorum pv. hederae]PUF01266.1 conjugal transfer protein TraN [Xanthomonas hortorum pv. hederae]